MRRYVILAVSFLLLAGCSTTIHVRSDEPLDNDRVFNYDQVNARVDGVPSAVVCRDGRTYVTSHAFVTPDTTVFVEAESGIRYVIPTGSVESIECRDHALGALTGILAGGMVGLGAGIAAGLYWDWDSGDQRMGALMFLMAGPPVGALLGGVIGSFSGSPQIYNFTPDEKTETSHAAPPDTTGRVHPQRE